MKIRFASTNRFEEKISYSFEGQKVTAVCEGKSDEVDFTSLEDGEAENHNENLSSCWLKRAKKQSGEVYLILYQRVGPGHFQHYSDWMDTSEYNDELIYNQRLGGPDQNPPEDPMEYSQGGE